MVVERERLDVRVSVVNDVVAIARASGLDRNDTEISAPNDDLGVARPAVVLGLGGGLVIAGGHERPVDDPRPPSIWIDGSVQEAAEARDQIREDPMCLGLRDREGGASSRIVRLVRSEVHTTRTRTRNG